MIYSIGTTRYTGFLRKSMPKTALADVWTKDKSGLSEKEIVEKMVDLAHIQHSCRAHTELCVP